MSEKSDDYSQLTAADRENEEASDASLSCDTFLLRLLINVSAASMRNSVCMLLLCMKQLFSSMWEPSVHFYTAIPGNPSPVCVSVCERACLPFVCIPGSLLTMYVCLLSQQSHIWLVRF